MPSKGSTDKDAASHSLHENPLCMLRKRAEVSRVRREDGPPWFSEGDHERIDGRAPTSPSSELRGSPSNGLRHHLDDIAHLEKTIGGGVSPRLALQALDQHNGWNHRGP